MILALNYLAAFAKPLLPAGWFISRNLIKKEMKAKDFDNLLQTVEFELTQRQRFLLFEELYTKYSFDDMAKFEKTMLKQIKSSVEMLSEETAKDVTKSCNIILKAYKEWEK